VILLTGYFLKTFTNSHCIYFVLYTDMSSHFYSRECYYPHVYISVLLVNYSDHSRVYFVLIVFCTFVALFRPYLYDCGLSTTIKDTFDLI